MPTRTRKPKWRIVSVTFNGPDVKRRAGHYRIKATDGVRVIHADVKPDAVEKFDPETHWQTVLANRKVA